VLNRVTRVVLFVGALSGIPAGLSAQERFLNTLPILTRIEDIRALTQDEGQRGYPVRIRATVTHFDEILQDTLIVHDGLFGQFISTPPHKEKFPNWRELRAGELVDIEGRTERGGFAPNVVPFSIRRLGRGPMPAGKRLTFSELITGRYDCDYVDIAGVIQRAWLVKAPSQVMYADVQTGDGIVRAAFWNSKPRDATRLIDARVQLRGNLGTIFGPTEQLSGLSLFAGRIEDTVVLEAPSDPFSLPERSIQKIFNYSSSGDANRRIRVRGAVTAWIPGAPVTILDFTTSATFRFVVNVLYVKDGSGQIRIETEESPQVHSGDVVEAAGFPVITAGKPILRNAVLRVLGSGTAPAPLEVVNNVLTAAHDADLVRIKATLLSVIPGPTEKVLVLSAGDSVFDARLGVSQQGGTLDDMRPGSLLSVTGVYSYQTGPPPSFRVFLRTPADVQVLLAAHWWTLRHTAVMVTILGFVAGLGAWRMRALTSRKRLEYQAVLNERSRVAREIHDTVEQGLAGIALQLEALEGSLQTAPETARQSLGIAQQMVRYSMEETRRSVMDLRAQALERSDLAEALETLARQMTLNTPARAHVSVTGPVSRLDIAKEHHLLRIGLEALANALKHGRATVIDIELRFAADGTNLIVTDNGQGLDSAERASGGAHFGLQGVRERVDKLGGLLNIDSTPGAGTRLAVMIPAGAAGVSARVGGLG